ncbi:hypothetical protein Psi01_11640 [Planobispora siamensis]|uniref:Uncharacterized protein n=1 Tax=Planobispora siamensis TaxID=936338 RepID=A0A8J3SEN2_9ACTN|nr:hypothetical protein Psi01_11640 [Planobispora siamensis]
MRWQSGQMSTWVSWRTPRFQGLAPRTGSVCRAPHEKQGMIASDGSRPAVRGSRVRRITA